MMLSLIVALASSLFDVASVYFIYRRVNRMNGEEREREIRHVVRDYFESDEMKRILKQQMTDAINESEVSRSIHQLVVILCTNLDELKHSRLCEGEK